MQLNKPKKSIFCFNPFAKKNATLEKSDFFYDGKSSKKLRVFMKEIKLIIFPLFFVVID